MVAFILFLAAAITFGLLGGHAILVVKTDWPRGVAWLAWCVAMVAFTIWHGTR